MRGEGYEMSRPVGTQMNSILHLIMWTPRTAGYVEFVWDLIYYITKAALSVCFLQDRKKKKKQAAFIEVKCQIRK